jgi:hypothetical protein
MLHRWRSVPAPARNRIGPGRYDIADQQNASRFFVTVEWLRREGPYRVKQWRRYAPCAQNISSRARYEDFPGLRPEKNRISCRDLNDLAVISV